MSDAEFEDDIDYDGEVLDDFDEFDPESIVSNDGSDELIKTGDIEVGEIDGEIDGELDDGEDGDDGDDDDEDINGIEEDIEIEMEDEDLTKDYIYSNSGKPQFVTVRYAHDPTALIIPSNIMTKYQYTRVLAIRAQQIANFAEVYTDCGNIKSPIERAEKEIRDRKCPLCIKMLIGTDRNGKKIYNVFRVRDMEIPF